MKDLKTKINKLIVATLGGAILALPGFVYADNHGGAGHQEAPAELVAQAQGKTKQLGRQLKTELMKAIKEGGLTAGVEVCNHAAGPIAEGVSDQNWQVGRTSLKFRNPKNAPDQWEQEQLTAFAEALSAGQPAGKLKAVHWDDETQTLRYMSPIMTGAPCVNCHGVEVKPAVADKIKALYPDDKATGFEEGQLRGAFTVTYTASK